MTTGFGIDPVEDANGVTSSTTSEDIRQITGTLYSPGLLSGGLVTRSASALSYSISNGVAAFPIVVDTSNPPKPENRRTVLGPIPQTNLSTTAPVSGTRVDMIYAQQLTPGNDSANNVVVRIGPTLPPRSILLDTYIVSAGNTNSNSFVRTGNISYSLPYGTTGSLFFEQRVPTNGGFTTRSVVMNGSFYLPTDRLLSVQLHANLSANGAVGFDNSKYCEAGFDVFIDNVLAWSWKSMGLHQAWAENNWSDLRYEGAGLHTIRVEKYREVGPGTPVLRYKGVLLIVQDAGPIA